jgi:hypothetical protein
MVDDAEDGDALDESKVPNVIMRRRSNGKFCKSNQTTNKKHEKNECLLKL